MPQKSWAVGEEVLAADFNTYLQNQCVPVFTGAAQRDSQWPAPPTGATCVTTDTGTLWQRFSGFWYEPNGVLYRALKNTTTNGITTSGIDVFTASPGITIPAGRRISVVAHLYCEFVNNGGWCGAKMDGTLQAPRVAQFNVLAGAAILHGETTFTPSAATHTFTIFCAAITGTINIPGAVEGSYFEVRDLGAV